MLVTKYHFFWKITYYIWINIFRETKLRQKKCKQLDYVLYHKTPIEQKIGEKKAKIKAKNKANGNLLTDYKNYVLKSHYYLIFRRESNGHEHEILTSKCIFFFKKISFQIVYGLKDSHLQMIRTNLSENQSNDCITTFWDFMTFSPVSNNQNFE